jgi:hypothetical protein
VDGRDKPGHDEMKIFVVSLSNSARLVRPWIVHHQSHDEETRDEYAK